MGPLNTVNSPHATWSYDAQPLVSHVSGVLTRYDTVLRLCCFPHISWHTPALHKLKIQLSDKVLGSTATVLQTCTLLLRCRAVATRMWVAPCHNGAIFHDGKCSFYGLNQRAAQGRTANLSNKHDAVLRLCELLYYLLVLSYLRATKAATILGDINVTKGSRWPLAQRETSPKFGMSPWTSRFGSQTNQF